MGKWYVVEVSDLSELLKGATNRELIVEHLSSDRIKVRTKKVALTNEKGHKIYAESLIIKFKNEADAVAFKLRWA